MEFVLGEMRPLLIKLGKLLKEEYGLEQEVRRSIELLQNELMVIHAALNKVDSVPRDHLDEQVRVWAYKLRELSYNMEDAIDAFMVRVEKGPQPAAESNLNNKVKKFLERIVRLFTKSKDLHQISHAIEEAQDLAKQCAELRQRYMFDFSTVKDGATLDPRVLALYKDARELVGIEHPRDKIIEKLFNGDEESKLQLRKISIVGFAGLGKTTLAKAVYEKITSQFDCNAFVSVSQTPDITRIFKKMLYGLDQKKFANINEAIRDEVQLIDELRNFLKDKRYLGLRYTRVVELPREIGDLVHLQTLDARDAGLEALPATVGKLSKLMRLCIDGETRLPFGVGNMKSLQELLSLTVTEDSRPNIIVELCKLTNLRVLSIVFLTNIDNSSLKVLVESLCSLRRIQQLDISFISYLEKISGWEGWEPPLQLCIFSMHGVLARLPAWENCKHLSQLCFHVLELETRDLDILANMPELRFLGIYIVGRFSWTIAGDGLFPSLRDFVTNITVTFLEGAMPMLTRIYLKLQVSMDDAAKNVGLGNLLQLNTVNIDLRCRGATTREVEEAEVAARRMVDGHPNCPCIGVHKTEEDLMKEDEDDGDDEEISDPDEAERDDDEEEISDTDQESDSGTGKGRNRLRTSSPQTFSSQVQHLRNEDEDDEEKISASEVDGNDHDEEISATDQECQPEDGAAKEEEARHHC